MSNVIQARPRIIRGKHTFHIVASQFNARYVQGLVDHAKKELRTLAPNATVSIQRVPGAFEIPVVVGELASLDKADAIIACGVILKGKTNHAQNLSRSVTDALQRIAVDHAVPVINAVLSFDDEIRMTNDEEMGEISKSNVRRFVSRTSSLIRASSFLLHHS